MAALSFADQLSRPPPPRRTRAVEILDRHFLWLPSPATSCETFDYDRTRASHNTARRGPLRFQCSRGPTDAPFWIAMYVASGLETNLGDLNAQSLDLGLVAAFFLTMIVSAVLIYADLEERREDRSVLLTAIVIFRAGATNVGDFVTTTSISAICSASLVLAAADDRRRRRTTPPTPGGPPDDRPPYWGAMFVAGVSRHHLRRSRRAYDDLRRCCPHSWRGPRRGHLRPRALRPGCDDRLLGQSFSSSAPPELRSATGSPRATASGLVCRSRARSARCTFSRRSNGGAGRHLHNEQERAAMLEE